jgi:hypothetical protein
MSLIIGVRCKNGCLVIADRRTHIKTNGTHSFRDDYTKVLLQGGYLVYNHGYNRIADADWKHRVTDLSPDPANPVYAEILKEMATKADKHAAYVFMNMDTLLEIIIRVGSGITKTDHMPKDRIVSGSGDKYVKLTLLTDLPKANCGIVRPKLVSTFKAAHDRMKQAGGIEFSENHDIVRI